MSISRVRNVPFLLTSFYPPWSLTVICHFLFILIDHEGELSWGQSQLGQCRNERQKEKPQSHLALVEPLYPAGPYVCQSVVTLKPRFQQRKRTTSSFLQSSQPSPYFLSLLILPLPKYTCVSELYYACISLLPF